MLAVIGDIHGCFYTLSELYSNLREKYPRIPVYCVGDLVDRGNHSREVINFIISNKIKFTPGNHDYMFFHYYSQPSSVFARSWIYNGSETTVESYKEFNELIYKHIKIIASAPFFINTKDCFISHAGLSNKYRNELLPDFENKNDKLKQLIQRDFTTDIGILWTRDKLLNIGKLQIVGHTRKKDVILELDSNSLYIDTGACGGNKLSAVVIEKNEIVEILEEKTHLNDIV
jgi:serine/threonine protein phosphatase 1